VDVVVVDEQQEGEEAGASGKRKASSEAGITPQEEERHAMLSFVMTTLGDQLVTELMQGFHPPRCESGVVGGGDASDTSDSSYTSDTSDSAEY
jgi:hypothetical protein